jgi:hypothetical protein
LGTTSSGCAGYTSTAASPTGRTGGRLSAKREGRGNMGNLKDVMNELVIIGLESRTDAQFLDFLESTINDVAEKDDEQREVAEYIARRIRTIAFKLEVYGYGK